MKLTDATRELLARPSLEGLAYALRHPEVWPEGFEWDYSLTKTCAMGLASKLWAKNEEANFSPARFCMEKLNLPVSRVFMLFTTQHGCMHMHDVTPAHVANAIDRFLAR